MKTPRNGKLEQVNLNCWFFPLHYTALLTEERWGAPPDWRWLWEGDEGLLWQSVL